MKQIVMKRKCDKDKVDHITGWLFTYAGLQLVATKEYTNYKRWCVYEYSTGYGLGCGASPTTRRGAMSDAQGLLDRISSLQICKTIWQVIESDGILNQPR